MIRFTLRTGPLARPHGTLDAGLRRRAFPPDAASLLPGALAPTGTGLTPAGGCELMSRSDHRMHHLRTLGARWSTYGAAWLQPAAISGKSNRIDGCVDRFGRQRPGMTPELVLLLLVHGAGSGP